MYTTFYTKEENFRTNERFDIFFWHAFIVICFYWQLFINLFKLKSAKNTSELNNEYFDLKLRQYKKAEKFEKISHLF